MSETGSEYGTDKSYSNRRDLENNNNNMEMSFDRWQKERSGTGESKTEQTSSRSRQEIQQINQKGIDHSLPEDRYTPGGNAKQILDGLNAHTERLLRDYQSLTPIGFGSQKDRQQNISRNVAEQVNFSTQLSVRNTKGEIVEIYLPPSKK